MIQMLIVIGVLHFVLIIQDLHGVDKNNLRARPAGTGDSTYVDKVFHCWSDISQGYDPPADHYESIFG